MTEYQNPTGPMTHRGGCHCKAVRFEAQLDLARGGSRCNCSLCTMVAQTGIMVKPADFRVTHGAESLSEYRIGESVHARHFCKRCGIQVFGTGNVPQIGGDYVSVNANCLDDIELAGFPVAYFDGRHDNWMAGTRPEPWPSRP